MRRDKYRWNLSRCLWGCYLLRIDEETKTLWYGMQRHSEARRQREKTVPKWSDVRYV